LQIADSLHQRATQQIGDIAAELGQAVVAAVKRAAQKCEQRQVVAQCFAPTRLVN
jgi:4-hydroxy-L-threonine phosphate dehydrogenase PdxA